MNESYKNFLEAKIYLEERDGGCNYANDLRRKYPEYVDLVNITDIYRRIVNYRVKNMVIHELDIVNGMIYLLKKK